MSIITKIKNRLRITGSWGFALPMAGILIGIIGVACAVEWYAGWRGIHEYQSPIVFQMPWYEVEPTILSPYSDLPIKTEEEIMAQYKLAPVLRSIYFLESTAGENDGCKAEGKINGFGYRQHNSEWKCYNTFEEVVEVVNIWFEERLSMNGNDIAEAVCLYNTGVPHQSSCVYSQNFMSVIIDRL